VQVGTHLVSLVVVLLNTTGYLLMQKERVVQLLHELATHDPLTGATNRRAMRDVLHRNVALSARTHLPLSLLMVDIDHFKRVNDALGHAGGDAALVHVAGLLGRECRAVDRLARLGGEEFGLLLPGSDQGAALALAARLHQRLHEQPLQWQGQVWPLRASFGVALGEAGDDAGCTRLLQRADQLLYQAKAQGRDRICVETAVQGDAA
jgi:diguanylate cyclase (GGDEF)-like protein